MTLTQEQLQRWIADMTSSIDQQTSPQLQLSPSFFQEPELVFCIVDWLKVVDENTLDDKRSYYSACIYALDLGVAQLQSMVENGNKYGAKVLNRLMQQLAEAIREGTQSLSFWLPVLNAFYDVHVELSPVLREAYLDAADEEEPYLPENEGDHLQSIRDIIDELSDLSVFEIASNFFAQSYAMPPDFFSDLVIDLYSITQGEEIALLGLLHPDAQTRDVVVSTLEGLMDSVVLSPVSLTRLKKIKHWYPAAYHAQFDRWIRIQRKKGVTFLPEKPAVSFEAHASEIDGSGAQGIFIHWVDGKLHRLSGLLLKNGLGIKDVWITPGILKKEVGQYYKEALDDAMTLRPIGEGYLFSMVNHFLAQTLAEGRMPDLHLLEIQELLHMQFKPQSIDIQEQMAHLTVKIMPFTPETLQASFKRSKTWLKTKAFTESWYMENANVDKLVNRCSTIREGVKFCDMERAIDEVFQHEMEQHRAGWLFHFVWVALWVDSKPRKNEKIGADCTYIAYSIAQNMPLQAIPLLQEICRESIINSIETMNERRTYLSSE